MKLVSRLALLLAATTAARASVDCDALVAQASNPDSNITAFVDSLVEANLTAYDLVSQCHDRLLQNLPSTGTSTNSLSSWDSQGCDQSACNMCMTVCMIWVWMPVIWGICMGACAAAGCKGCTIP